MNDFFTQVAQLAHEKPAEEVCGFLLYDGQGSLVPYPAKNLHANPRQHFEIDPEHLLDAVKTKRLCAVYHSHVECDHRLSEDDIRAANTCQLPFLSYSVLSKQFDYYRPLGAVRPYVGRQFVLLVQDCVALVSDYVEAQFKIRIPFQYRTPAHVRNGLNGAASTLLDLGFRQVEKPENGDLLLISIYGDQRINHCGVYQNGDVLLHQLSGRMSCRQRYSPSWSSHTRFVFRKAA